MQGTEHLNNIWDFLLFALPFVFTWAGIQLKTWYMNYRANKYKLVWHSIFLSLDNSIREVKAWVYKENRQVFADALIIKLKVWKEEGEKLAKELDKKTNISNSELEYKLIFWMNDTIEIYTKLWVEAKIPQKVIQNINIEHELKIGELTGEIKAIVHNNDAYPTMKTKCISVFDALKHLLAETKNDFSTLIYRRKYNGNMIGVKYKGVSISDIEFIEQNIIKNELT